MQVKLQDMSSLKKSQYRSPYQHKRKGYDYPDLGGFVVVSVMAETKPCATAYIKSGDGSKVVSQCGYYRKPLLVKEKILPLECSKCKGLYHVRCLRGPKPPVFLFLSIKRSCLSRLSDISVLPID